LNIAVSFPFKETFVATKPPPVPASVIKKSYSRQSSSHGPLLRPLCQCSSGQGAQVRGSCGQAHHHRGGASEGPSPGWAEIIRKVYEVDALVCPECGGWMKINVFITDFFVLDRIINDLKLCFIADKLSSVSDYFAGSPDGRR
jgi:hypothetical protein